ncbi:MAG TPA: hypothetical protein VFB72_03955, partial [Verrucomicrobiae bacterium]|nr:hypothetical protein [Verrucomicrobiae bacterium]
MELNLPFSGRRGFFAGGLLLLACLLMCGISARAENSPATSTNSANANADADKAWKEVKKLTQEPMPPESWQQK